VPSFLNFTRNRNCNNNESLLDSNRARRNNLSPVPALKTTGLDPSDLGTEKGAQEPDAEQEQILRAIEVSHAEEVERQRYMFASAAVPPLQVAADHPLPSLKSRVRKRALRASRNAATESAKKRGRIIFTRLASSCPVLGALLEDEVYPGSQDAFEEVDDFLIGE